MNTYQHYEQEIEVENLEGEVFSRLDFTLGHSEIAGEIDAAIAGGKRSGNLGSGGNLWRWRILPERVVTLEFTRQEQVVQTYQVPEKAWKDFERHAQCTGSTAREYLSLLLGQRLAEGESIEAALEWLFS